MNDFLEIVKGLSIALGLALAIIIVLTLLTAYPIVAYEKYACRKTAEKMGYECDWSFTYGCMINVNGKWTTIKAYRVME